MPKCSALSTSDTSVHHCHHFRAVVALDAKRPIVLSRRASSPGVRRPWIDAHSSSASRARIAISWFAELDEWYGLRSVVMVGRGAREGGLRQGGRLTKARGRSPRRGKTGLASLNSHLKAKIPADWRAAFGCLAALGCPTIRKWWQWSRMVALVNTAGHWYFSS